MGLGEGKEQPMSKNILLDVKAHALLLLLCLTLNYQRVQTCVAVEVPTNADLGCPLDIWKCDQGFRKSASGKSCVPLEDPPSGYMDVHPRHAPHPGILHDETWWA